MSSSRVESIQIDRARTVLKDCIAALEKQKKVNQGLITTLIETRGYTDIHVLDAMLDLSEAYRNAILQPVAAKILAGYYCDDTRAAGFFLLSVSSVGGAQGFKFLLDCLNSARRITDQDISDIHALKQRFAYVLGAEIIIAIAMIVWMPNILTLLLFGGLTLWLCAEYVEIEEAHSGLETLKEASDLNCEVPYRSPRNTDTPYQRSPTLFNLKRAYIESTVLREGSMSAYKQTDYSLAYSR